jgi:NADPH-dependent 2,4-dienoyl-CoA reductase/sulfur reductase-like enzyme/nitrite reductase/ring-hydroxylating ferredoxin subunit
VAAKKPPPGPDLVDAGLPFAELEDGGMVLGHAGDEPVLVARRGDEVFAIGSKCTHYGGPLAKGLMVDDTVRCPWHHACFSLRTGEAVCAPALDPVPQWRVDRRDGRIYVTEKQEREPLAPAPGDTGVEPDAPAAIVIVGAGAAGSAAAEMLRRQGYTGRLTMIDPDLPAPYDRPNLSKSYLAGTAPREYVPLRPDDFYQQHGIERINVPATAIDVNQRQVRLADGATLDYDALLLATGAEPRSLTIPGHDLPHVHLLRSLADCEAIIARAEQARRAVVIGASFIGLEVAASLRARELEVHVVAPSPPLAKVFGPELGVMIQALHEEHGVVFHLGQTAARIEPETVILESGERLAADLVVVGIGVSPRVDLAEAAGLTVDNGVVVDEYLQTSAPGVYAAGDIARWPDPHTGENIRVEHWVVAQRQGQTAARNLVGQRQPFDDAPFFWSGHYNLSVRYTGHATEWDRIDIDGSTADRACSVAYRQNGKTLAVASVKRDLENLKAEAHLEENDEAALHRLVAPAAG